MILPFVLGALAGLVVGFALGMAFVLGSMRERRR